MYIYIYIHKYSSFFIIQLPSWELSHIPYLPAGTFEDDDLPCPVWWDILLFGGSINIYTNQL